MPDAHTRIYLIVARSPEDAETVERRLCRKPRRVRVITTARAQAMPFGLMFDEVVWVAGWRLGPRAAYVERWVRHDVAKRPAGRVVECEATT